MNTHDAVKEIAEQSLEAKISPKFAELTADILEIMDKASDPKITAALLFKLAEERQKTNQLIEDIARKHDEIMLHLKTKQAGADSRPEFDLLPDQDKTILAFVGERGQATASDVQSVINYRGLNGASQRLNKLCKEGFLEKARSGKKVLYLAKI